MQPEARLTSKMIATIKKRGGFAVKIRGGPDQQRGLPDIVATYGGYFIGIEVKMPGRENKVSLIQAATLRNIKEGGGLAFVFTTVEQVIYLLDAIDKKATQ